MRTKEETEKAFKKDFQKLLKKYKAEFEIESEDLYLGSPERGHVLKATICISSNYSTKTDKLIQEYTNFDLGNYLSHEE